MAQATGDTSRSSITCQYEEIIGPPWPLPDDEARRLYNRLQTSRWIGDPPARLGIVDFRPHSSHIFFGNFVSERLIPIVEYDDQKNAQEHIEESFDHFWFVLFLEEGRFLVQRRRIPRVSMDDILNKFRVILRTHFEAEDIPIQQFQPFESYTSKDEFLQLFHQGGVTEVHIDNLTDREVPADVSLFNPNVDRDRMLKAFVANDNRQLAEIWVKAPRRGDLSGAHIIDAEMHAGDPRLLRRRPLGGTGTVTHHREVREKLEVVVSQTETKVVPTPAQVEDLVAEVKGQPRPTRRRRPNVIEGQESLF